jgi:hypothetical protein
MCLKYLALVAKVRTSRKFGMRQELVIKVMDLPRKQRRSKMKRSEMFKTVDDLGIAALFQRPKEVLDLSQKIMAEYDIMSDTIVELAAKIESLESELENMTYSRDEYKKEAEECLGDIEDLSCENNTIRGTLVGYANHLSWSKGASLCYDVWDATNHGWELAEKALKMLENERKMGKNDQKTGKNG